jgi:hypothetical protein
MQVATGPAPWKPPPGQGPGPGPSGDEATCQGPAHGGRKLPSGAYPPAHWRPPNPPRATPPRPPAPRTMPGCAPIPPPGARIVPGKPPGVRRAASAPPERWITPGPASRPRRGPASPPPEDRRDGTRPRSGPGGGGGREPSNFQPAVHFGECWMVRHVTRFRPVCCLGACFPWPESFPGFRFSARMRGGCGFGSGPGRFLGMRACLFCMA